MTLQSVIKINSSLKFSLVYSDRAPIRTEYQEVMFRKTFNTTFKIKYVLQEWFEFFREKHYRK